MRRRGLRHRWPRGIGKRHQHRQVAAAENRPRDAVVSGRRDRSRGAEFAALLPSAGLEQAELVAERLRQAVLGLPIVVDEESNAGANMTISLGVAQLKPGDSLATLTAAADAALYRAKSEGRNCVRGAKR